MTRSKISQVITVLPSQDIKRDIEWYSKYVGFDFSFGDTMYAGIIRGDTELHLQWHADTEKDPLLGGSVVKFFVDDITPFFEEFVKRGTIVKEKLRRNTPWGTHEFGFYDLNTNAIFFVQDI
ncbi:VOC family protein [Patiriisocius hiemis]|uniref:Glyoxalase/bleomycin resistance/extradiol dioxygenase family protein n=1 Tax=Patiriisocius hiemis TaxID=3075604 RepID=A0ABU2Y9T6_9FLAO|nr:VOC family protein [Constantimarinum sp. W242]MDT0554414.1 glyoxalase/bleomycin resistance/extradiol dioxygenase family protein [Constantimarinum sp. W242]